MARRRRGGGGGERDNGEFWQGHKRKRITIRLSFDARDLLHLVSDAPVVGFELMVEYAQSQFVLGQGLAKRIHRVASLALDVYDELGPGVVELEQNERGLAAPKL